MYVYTLTSIQIHTYKHAHVYAHRTCTHAPIHAYIQTYILTHMHVYLKQRDFAMTFCTDCPAGTNTTQAGSVNKESCIVAAVVAVPGTTNLVCESTC